MSEGNCPKGERVNKSSAENSVSKSCQQHQALLKNHRALGAGFDPA